jgi:hypothetical protein
MGFRLSNKASAAIRSLTLIAFSQVFIFMTEAQVINPCSTCLPEGIVIVRQTQIDSFHLANGNCSRIQGDVTITGAKIKNLHGFSGVRIIDGDFEVKSTTLLETLAGLDSLISVGGTLQLEANQGLKNLSGLQSLTLVGGFFLIGNNVKLTELNDLDNILNVGGLIAIYKNNALPEIRSFNKMVSLDNLTISENERLDRVTGFTSVTYVAGTLRIQNHATLRHLTAFRNMNFAMGIELYHNPVLETLEAFGRLKTIGDNGLKIVDNQRLTSITGFSMLSEINGLFYLGGNPELFNLSGFENLHSVQGRFNVSENENLTSLDAFESLEQMNGDLIVRSNKRLKSLKGLDNIDPTSIIGMIIDKNDSLSDCAVYAVCKYLQYSNFGNYINNNAPGCNSKAEVDSACTHLSSGFREMDTEIRMFPNPADNQVVIQCSTRGKLTIFNLNGLEMFSTSIRPSQVTIDVSLLPTGFYVLRCVSNNAVRFMNFIKK